MYRATAWRIGDGKSSGIARSLSHKAGQGEATLRHLTPEVCNLKPASPAVPAATTNQQYDENDDYQSRCPYHRTS